MLVTCFEHIDIKWCHLLIAPLHVECETKRPVLLILTNESEKQKLQNCASDGPVTLANGFFGVELYQLRPCIGIQSLQIIFREELRFISLAVSFSLILCLLQLANSKCRVNWGFYKSIIKVHWISRQAYSIRKKS